MNGFIFGSVGLVSAMLWLVLLVATGFNILAVSAGLLAAVFVTGERSHSSHGAD